MTIEQTFLDDERLSRKEACALQRSKKPQCLCGTSLFLMQI